MTVSIKDVALKAGVSVATVSRVLGSGPVSDALRARVEEAVAATGYRPNLSARRLRSQHSQTIGLIVSDIRNPFFTAVSRAVEDAAFQAGMRVILCNTDENPDREAMYLRLMQEERVTGLIFAPTRTTLGRLDRAGLDFPVVLIDRSGPSGLYDSVVLDNQQAAAALVGHLHAQGYRRIAGLFGNTSTTAVERHGGYHAAMIEHGLTPDARFVPPYAEAAEAEVAGWLADGSSVVRPDAVMVSNSLLLMGVVKAARKHGLSIPGDLALAGFDNEAWTELVGPGLTVIEQPVHEIGCAAMNLLFERLDVPDRPTRKVVLSGTCVVRGSTAPWEASRV
ncbi:LacI family DNA-binding transcriptional regulator [Azospirillum rugosum]|uniref:LacI family fructose operon transcriptional repressor n=1 Tax=Azospirillum rugosum TaxID=416170 RepID=A0ABS4SJC3_9PROT|nr:LacI family DNA-binding transcriptional regulator [Azospirillum rugosum]MBP2292666.1 LacI family fructose operon transcriptional repressor [Azospirillum rugosum]MDQ0526310.1 LacI family fructose operon transcriptional repressor [Azospirillum rugosum]